MKTQRHYNMTKNLEEHIDLELKKLDRCMVVTPDEKQLNEFSRANHGCADAILTQMATQFGYKMAMDEIKELIEA